MLAIPFFVMAGEFMSVGGLTDKLVNLAYAFVGHVRGSLGHVTTLSSMLFASMSGSSTAAVASIGGMLLPAMKKKGYGEGYAASIVCASAVLGSYHSAEHCVCYVQFHHRRFYRRSVHGRHYPWYYHGYVLDDHDGYLCPQVQLSHGTQEQLVRAMACAC